MNMVDAERSHRISFLSFLCSCLVIFWHAHFLGIGQKDSLVVNRILQDVISQGFARASVPYFLVVFGFFLFHDWPFGFVQWQRKVVSRVRSLAVPYVLWVVIGLVFAFLFMGVTGRGYVILNPSSPRWWLGVFGMCSGVPVVSYHLWFVRNIFFVALLSPIMGFVLFCAPKVCLAVLFTVAIGFDTHLGGKAQLLFFVCLGAWVAEKGFSLTWIDRNVWKLFALWSVLIFGKTYFAKEGFDVCFTMPVLNLVGVIALWGLGSVSARFCHGVFLGCSFFVYCLHLSVLQWCVELLKMILKVEKPETNVSCLLVYIIPPLLTAFVCYVVAVFMRKHLPEAYAVLSGGRK